MLVFVTVINLKLNNISKAIKRIFYHNVSGTGT